NLDQALLTPAGNTLNDLPVTLPLVNPANHAIKVKVGASFAVDVTGDGIVIVETPSLKLSHKSSMTITGGPTDVVMFRILSGRMIFGYGAAVNLVGGMKPENVLFYSKWHICRLAPGVTGGGTVVCPDANKFIIGSGVDWSGTFLGGSREIRTRNGSNLTHVLFVGF